MLVITRTLEDFQAELDSWRDTGYCHNKGVKGDGVDCLRFAVAIEDWLHGYDPSQLPKCPKLPVQTALHNPRAAIRIANFLRKRYPSFIVWDHREPPCDIREFELLPGDFIVTNNTSHPGHVMVAAPRKNVVFHANSVVGMDHHGGVIESSLGEAYRYGLQWIFRSERHRDGLVGNN